MLISKRDLSKGLIWGILMTLVVKVFLTLISVNLAVNFKNLPSITTQMDYLELIPKEKNIWYYLAQPFYRFDSLWYEIVGKTNYIGIPKSSAFFPLFPWIVMGFSSYFKISYFLSAYFLSTIFACTAFILFYLLIKIISSEKVALRSLVLFSFFPTSFFLFSSYAEPLLLTFFYASILASFSRNYFLAGILGMFASMTKPYGWIVIFPVLGMMERNKDLKLKSFNFVSLLLIPLGTIFVYLFQNFMLYGTFLKPVSTIPTWRTLVNPVVHIIKGLKMMAQNPFDIPNLINVFSVILGLYLLFKASEGKKLFDWLFILFFLLITLSLEANFLPLISFSRHVLLLYPLFVFLAGEKFSKTIFPVIISLSGGLMIMLFMLYSLGFFVG